MISINQSSIPKHTIDTGITQQPLLTQRIKGAAIRLEMLTLAAGATRKFDAPAQSLAWFQMLAGEARLSAVDIDPLSASSSVVLPPGYPATLSTKTGATLLYVEIADAARLDPGFSDEHPLFMVLDWKREPVLVSTTDGRKRISLINPDICRTKAIKIEMVIYPPGSMSPNYHDEGAESFVYVVGGHGIAWANEQPFSASPGDLIYFPDGERRYFKAADGGELQFLQLHMPGVFKSVWTDPSKVSAWRLTRRDVNGGETEDDERERIVYRKIFGNPWTR